ncbi:hypothetical protein [uncultured Micrococcus sp.]|uniref:hypothetical protein n=1 Tax=uncultured Micrococcus sp. TaxID=114051 RepID=UPI0025F12572|nr:hypothetical protein [uncultured Micrococcus sp.]
MDWIEVEMSSANPPHRIRPVPLDPAEHAGEYRPEPALLEILARLAGAAAWEQATAAQRARALAAAAQLRTAGLDPRAIGLVSEVRVAQLQGMERPAARVARSKVEGFPTPAVTVRLWDETDVEEHLRWRVQQAPYPRRFKNRYAPSSTPGQG